MRSSVLARISAGLGERLAAPMLTIAVAAGHGTGSQPLRDLTQIRNAIGGTSVHPLLDALWVPLFTARSGCCIRRSGLLAVLSAGALFVPVHRP